MKAVLHFFIGAAATFYLVVLHVLAGMGAQEAFRIYHTIVQYQQQQQEADHNESK